MKTYIGTYTRPGGPGIAVCEYENGTLSLLAEMHDLEDPIWLEADRENNRLFALGRLPGTENWVAALYELDGGMPVLRCMMPTGGEDCCWCTLSPEKKHLYIANYRTGSLTVLPVNGFAFGDRLQLITHSGSGPVRGRQDSAHIHQCVFRPGTRELFVCDLGSDKVAIYTQEKDTGMIWIRDAIATGAGIGPRHLLFDGPDRFYLVGELSSTVSRYEYTEKEWICRETVSVLPEGFSEKNTAAAILMNSGALYISNRGHNSICRVPLSEDGSTGAPEWLPCGGELPRDLAFMPDGRLLAANQGSGGISDGTETLLNIPGAVRICY